jgi:hypothetical protein
MPPNTLLRPFRWSLLQRTLSTMQLGNWAAAANPRREHACS